MERFSQKVINYIIKNLGWQITDDSPNSSNFIHQTFPLYGVICVLDICLIHMYAPPLEAMCTYQKNPLCLCYNLYIRKYINNIISIRCGVHEFCEPEDPWL